MKTPASSRDRSRAALGLPFTKMSGAGNDFVVLVEPPTDLDLAQLTRLVCRRGTSVGADGLFVLRRIVDGARMTHHNADGGEAELCLNGTRCAAAMALRLGWHQSGQPNRVRIETGAGAVDAEATSAGLRMQVPEPGPVREVELEVAEADFASAGLPTADGVPHRLLASTCDTGVPHVVVQVQPEVLPTVDLERFGPCLRAHPDLGAAGANVNFLAACGDSRPVRTFERGVEGETLACGTGAVACAAVLLAGAEGTQRFRTRGGFDLVVDARCRPDGELVWCLTGEARFVFEGTIEQGALVDIDSDR